MIAENDPIFNTQADGGLADTGNSNDPIFNTQADGGLADTGNLNDPIFNTQADGSLADTGNLNDPIFNTQADGGLADTGNPNDSIPPVENQEMSVPSPETKPVTGMPSGNTIPIPINSLILYGVAAVILLITVISIIMVGKSEGWWRRNRQGP